MRTWGLASVIILQHLNTVQKFKGKKMIQTMLKHWHESNYLPAM